MRFAIFTHVEHLKSGDRYYAYPPYVREMNIWLRHVEEVEVLGTRRTWDEGKRGRGDERTGRSGDGENMGIGETGTGGNWEKGIAYEHAKLTFTEVPAFNFLSFSASVKSVLKLPFIFFRILGVMRRADHLHLRCPGNVGLLACIAQIFFPSKPISAKYAGNWDPKAKQPWTYRFQKWILSNTFLTRNMQVLVYGEWPSQTQNVVPFFTASFSEKEIPELQEKLFSGPLTFLFVGNLVKGKRPLEAIKLVKDLNVDWKEDTDQEIRANLEIYGDGPERKKLEDYVREHKLEEWISFKGSRPLGELKKAYQKAHFVVLPSKSEGWPKAIAEGMFFGCIPIATPVSCVPWMLGGGSRGVLLENRLLDTFQKSRQFECSSNPAEAGWKNGSRTGFSETPACRQGRLEVTVGGGKKEWSVFSDQWSEEVERIMEVMTNPQKMKQMSEEAKKWSQQYTLEKFEKAIEGVLLNSHQKIIDAKGKLSPAPFRGRGKTGKG